MNIVAPSEPMDRLTAVSALRDFIEAGSYGPGDRLPPERELIVQLGMSRTVLRKALDLLEQDGAIWRHVGKGTFISSERDADGAGSIAEIGKQITPVRMLRARLCIEPAVAREAAINASTEAVARIRRAQTAAENAETWDEYERQDDLFHRAVAEASDNILLVTLFNQLNQVRRTVSWNAVTRQSARPPAGHKSFAEHEKIATAIEAREPSETFEAMRAHIGSVSARLFGEM